MSKELRNVQKALMAYVRKHKGDVVVNASLCTFKGTDCKVVDSMAFSFGDKKTLLVDLKCHIKELKKNKDDFICW